MAPLPTASQRASRWGWRGRMLPALAVALAIPAGAFALLTTSAEPATPPLGSEVADAAPPVPSSGVGTPAPGATASNAGGPASTVRLEGQARKNPLPRWRPVRTEAAALALLRRARGWTAFLEAWISLPPATGAAQRLERVERVRAGLDDPVVRQNAIFLAAVTLPWEVVRPWLEGLRTGTDADDAEDALCALAFSGEPDATAAFRALARTSSGADVRRLVDWHEQHDALAREGTRAVRDVLRAWRAIEVLDRTPYFRLVAYHATRVWGEGADVVLAWRPHAVDASVKERLLEAWLDRYPGHPGSDNMAVRLGHLRAAAGDAVGAARWFARALALPDQLEAARAAGPLVVLCETILPPDVLLSLAGSAGSVSRSLFLYAHVRRLAAGTGFETACRALEVLADREPDLVLSVAWRNRWSAPVPAGLASGLEPLAPGDPLLRVEGAAAAWPPALAWKDGREVDVGSWDRSWEPSARLEPLPDTCVLDRDRLVRQVRAWDTLAELERRTARARGSARADLLYKQAAVLYHDRDVLFPAYGSHTYRFRGTLAYEDPMAREGQAAEESRRRLASFGEESFAWERARVLFERLEQEHASYPALDRAVFSAGMCWKRLVDYRPRGGWDGYGGDDAARAAVRACVACFERVAREWPTSPLADDAGRAAAWWRRNRPEAFSP